MAELLESVEGVQAFLEREDREDVLYELSRTQLTWVAQHYGIKVDASMKKGSILLNLVQVMTESGASGLKNVEDEMQLLRQRTKMKELELAEKRMDVEFEKIRGRERELERVFEMQKMKEERESELQKMKLEHESELQRMKEEREREREEREERERERAHELEMVRTRHNSPSSFDINGALKLVPVFKETEVAEFFIAFEKVANQLHWPKDKWTTLVQCKLVGKAQKVYVTLSEQVSNDYDQVKSLILKSYELIPEAYRQKFRELRKIPQQTYVEFAHLKSQAFDEWCRSRDVCDFEKLRELMLVEEFKQCVSRDLKVFLEESNVYVLEEAAKKADEYALSHKTHFRPKVSSFGDKFGEYSEKGKFGKNFPGKGISAPSKVGTGNRDIECYFCHRRGHVKNDCFLWKKKKTVSLVSNHEISKLSGLSVSKCHNQGLEGYRQYIHKGKVCSNANQSSIKNVVMLRDTGAMQSLILRKSLPPDFVSKQSEFVLLGGFPDTVTSCPVEDLFLESSLVKGQVRLAVVDKLPINGVDVIIANDLMNTEKTFTSSEAVPLVTPRPNPTEHTDKLFTVAAVTRSKEKKENEQYLSNLGDLFCTDVAVGGSKFGEGILGTEGREGDKTLWDVHSLIKEQKEDSTLLRLREKVVESDCVDYARPVFKLRDQILVRVSRPFYESADAYNVLTQIVVPSVYRLKILKLAHENILSGHFGVSKTCKRILQNFYWPRLKKDVKWFVKSCHQCQVVGSPNIKVTKAPLKPIPVVKEPFHEILIDIVGPLPKTKAGYIYLLTILDRTTRYPEAVPLRSMKADKVVQALVEFFSRYGLPESIQSDCGTNFTSKFFKDKMKELGVKHMTSSPYHPQSQGSIERFHQTLKTLFKKYCGEENNNWDKELPYLLFAIRSIPNDSLGLSPFDLVYGHNVRGPLDIIREHWEGDSPNINLLDFVSNSKERLIKKWTFARKYLGGKQEEMKRKYDVGTKVRNFEEGDLVLALLPFPGRPLKAAFSGPWRINKKVSNVNYLVETPCRRKKHQLCHVNMLKKYESRENVKSVMCVNEVKDEKIKVEWDGNWPETNSFALERLDEMLSHLDDEKKNDVKELIDEFKDLFKDSPGKTNILVHDVDVGDALPIRQHPYRMNPEKTALVDKEIQYMLQNGLIKHSNSPWSSPVVLVKKDHDQYRLCFDYRKLNNVSKPDNYPIPRVDDCIDAVGNSTYITKFDMLKGYWQVGMTPRAQEMSAFVTPRGLYECVVMPFGMRNSASTFQRLMNIITKDIKNCVVYIDDIVIYSDDWSDHAKCIRDFFLAVRDAGLVINLAKCEFARAKVRYLGHEVGFGQVIPKTSNVEAILDLKVPTCRKDVRRFLGAAGYFRKFVKNFAEISCPLTDLLKKDQRFCWDRQCQEAFDKIKAILTNHPVLKSPNFNKPFILNVDASDIGVGAILEQEDERGVKHPIAYFSKKLNGCQKKYSTIEKETLGLILALQHFEVYVSAGNRSVQVWTDHNPLLFINKFKNKNQRLTRWSLFLQEWDLDIRHIKGKDNVVPDILSRN